MTNTVPELTLNNGVTMPALGFGVFQSAPEDTATAVQTALETGVPPHRYGCRLFQRT